MADTADLSDHGPIIALQALQVRLGQWPSFTGMEYGAPHARAAINFLFYDGAAKLILSRFNVIYRGTSDVNTCNVAK